jgi:hypothetical protein
MGDKKCIQNFSGETSWKAVTWKTKREVERNIQMEVKKIGCEDERWIELAPDHV